ncbi:DUF4365 domain-containing protein [Microbacterium sp. KSW4-4]|uniref:DUF4365 domain-containing protein n=1 Tax=Microbacterium sp. KSW4-4 TaxID=2851651 RepID=UPI0035ABC0EE
MKEELSKAYLHALASATGLDVGSWGQDYDVRDVTLSSSVDYASQGGMYGPKIDVQLKCTGQESVAGPNTIAWSLDVRSIEKMARLNRSTPALFCVLTTNARAEQWLHHDTDGLLSRSHMYWMWGKDLPAVAPGSASVTVHIPRSNVLTPASLLELMEEASRWQPTF